MIELNKKTQQDFLNREWVQRLLDAGVDMSDAKYYIIEGAKDNQYIIYIDRTEIENPLELSTNNSVFQAKVIYPTYTISELLYKLHEWIYPTINGKKYNGGLTMMKDAPFYMFYYKLHSENYDPRKLSNEQPEEWDESFMGECEYPIESLASLLIQCHKRDIGIQRKDTGDISDK